MGCRDLCYSSIVCQYWQFYKSDGCWIDKGEIKPADFKTGLTKDGSPGYKSGSTLTKDSLGEYIQHFCKPPVVPDTATEPPLPASPQATTPEPSTNLTPLWVTLGVLGAAALAGGAAYFVMNQGAV